MPDFGSPTASTDSSEPETSSTLENESNSDSLSVSSAAGRKKRKSNVLKSTGQQPASKSNDLTDRIHAFKRNVAKLHKAHEKMLRRSDELDQREQELLSREQTLTDREGDFLDLPIADDSQNEIERAELDLLAETLDRRTKTLDEREASLDAKEKELAARVPDVVPAAPLVETVTESATDAERKELDQLRDTLTERTQDLERRERELETLQQTLQPDLEQLEAATKAFRQEQGHVKGALTKRENAIEAVEQSLDARDIELRQVRDELDRWQEEIDRQIAGFDKRETSLAERSQAIEMQITQLDRRTADHLNFATVLDQREQDLAVRESALNRVADTLKCRGDNLDKFKALIELRRRRVSFVREQLGRVSRKMRKGRRGIFSRMKASTVSIGPDDNELAVATALSPSAPAQAQGASTSAVDEPHSATVATVQTIKETTTVATTDTTNDDQADAMTASEKRLLATVAIVIALFAAIGFASYLLAGAMTNPTWRATLVLKSDAITSPQSLTDQEITAALNYLNDRGLRPAEDVTAFRNLLANKLTIDQTDRGITLAYLDHQPELATFILKGMQRGIQLQRGDSVQIVSAAAIDPKPFDDPRWRITYVLIAIGTLILLAGYGIVWRFTRRNRSE